MNPLISYRKRLAWCTACFLALTAASAVITLIRPSFESGLGLWTGAVLAALVICVLIGLYMSTRLRSALEHDIRQLRRAINQLAAGEMLSASIDFRCKELDECGSELATASEALRQKYTRLNNDATRDALTGLANRRTLMYTLEREMALVNRTGWPLAMIMVDIDHFKKFNDTYGHQAGDLVLQRTARRLSSLVRESDVVARFGGEEFAILLPGTHLDHATEIANQLRNSLRCDVVQFDGHELAVTASFGVAEVQTCAVRDTETLIGLADEALYDSKKAGRDRVTVSSCKTKPVALEANAPASQPTPTSASPQARAHPGGASPTGNGADASIDRDAMALMGSTFSILQVMPDKQRVARDVLQQVTAAMQCPNAAILLPNEQGELAIICRVQGTAETTMHNYKSTEAALAWFNEMVGLHMDAVIQASDAYTLKMDDHHPMKRMLIPLIHGSDIVGAMLATLAPEQEVTRRQKNVLTALSAIGAAALKNCEAYRKYEDRWIGLIEALCKTVHTNLAYRRDHGERVGALVAAVARALGLRDEDELQLLRVAGLVHDIGKIRIPQKLLLKRGRLKQSDREIMQKHCRIGAEIINRVPGMHRLAQIVEHHHEHYDGAGYPDGLAGDEIPIESRILAVADAYDAMVSERPYRTPLSHDEAISRLKRASGTQFDPDVVMTFVELSSSLQTGEKSAGEVLVTTI